MSRLRAVRAVVLWTGGKDCALALLRARRAGLDVDALVTFGPPRPRFRAHPLPRTRAQTRALDLPHRFLSVTPPYAAGYERHFARLRREGYRAVVTGDIDLVACSPSWISDRARPTGLRVVRPLWRQSRRRLLRALAPAGIRAEITAVRSPYLGPEWLGRVLDPPMIEELLRLASLKGFDPSGEEGEYHTMVVDGPGFAAPVPRTRRAVRRARDLWYLSARPSPAAP